MAAEEGDHPPAGPPQAGLAAPKGRRSGRPRPAAGQSPRTLPRARGWPLSNSNEKPGRQAPSIAAHRAGLRQGWKPEGRRRSCGSVVFHDSPAPKADARQITLELFPHFGYPFVYPLVTLRSWRRKMWDSELGLNAAFGTISWKHVACSTGQVRRLFGNLCAPTSPNTVSRTSLRDIRGCEIGFVAGAANCNREPDGQAQP
jgi:hypothetical protein